MDRPKLIMMCGIVASGKSTKAKDLAERFIKNFAKFTGNDLGKSLVEAGPKL